MVYIVLNKYLFIFVGGLSVMLTRSKQIARLSFQRLLPNPSQHYPPPSLSPCIRQVFFFVSRPFDTPIFPCWHDDGSFQVAMLDLKEWYGGWHTSQKTDYLLHYQSNDLYYYAGDDTKMVQYINRFVVIVVVVVIVCSRCAWSRLTTLFTFTY